MSSTGRAEPRAGLGEALGAEWVKLRGAHSATWTLAAMAACVIGVAALVGATRSLQPDDTVLGGSLTGAVPALVVAASFGALAMSGEYASGTIRVTLAACPRRGVVMAAKAMVVGTVLFGVGLAACLLAWRVGAAMLPDGYAPGSPVPALAGVGLCFSATGLLGLAAGTVLRHSAAAIPTMVTTLLLPTLVGPLLGGWGRWVAGASPVAALQKLAQSSDAAPEAVGSLGARPSLGLVAAAAAVALLAALLLLRRRDA
jgi:ABC-type transport system involved in multi-copper enzyme maturation permease subunit